MLQVVLCGVLSRPAVLSKIKDQLKEWDISNLRNWAAGISSDPAINLLLLLVRANAGMAAAPTADGIARPACARARVGYSLVYRVGGDRGGAGVGGIQVSGGIHAHIETRVRGELLEPTGNRIGIMGKEAIAPDVVGKALLADDCACRSVCHGNGDRAGGRGNRRIRQGIINKGLGDVQASEISS